MVETESTRAIAIPTHTATGPDFVPPRDPPPPECVPCLRVTAARAPGTGYTRARDRGPAEITFAPANMARGLNEPVHFI
jgi:hypothetical protein